MDDPWNKQPGRAFNLLIALERYDARPKTNADTFTVI